MANKNHPGKFRCYEAAMPDEPMFVILGRDPAGPATLAFWARQREIMGKDQEGDDLERIVAARSESEDMFHWRAHNVDGPNGHPTWRDPRPAAALDNYTRPTRMEPALGMPYKPDIRLKIAIGLRQVAEDLEQQWPADGAPPRKDDPVNQFLDRINGYALELETDSKADGDIYASVAKAIMPEVAGTAKDTFAKKMGETLGLSYESVAEDYRKVTGYDPEKTTLKYTLKVAEGLLLECEEALRKTGLMKNFDLHARIGSFIASHAKPIYWSNADEMSRDEDGTLCKPLSVSRMCELLDYATAYGEFDENTPSGTEAEKCESSPMNDMRRSGIWTLKRCLGLIPEMSDPPVADDTRLPLPVELTYGEGWFVVPGVEGPQSMEQIAETYRKLSVAQTELRNADGRIAELTAPRVAAHVSNRDNLVKVTEEMISAGYDATRLADGTPQFAEAGFCLGHAAKIYVAMEQTRTYQAALDSYHEAGEKVVIDAIKADPAAVREAFKGPSEDDNLATVKNAAADLVGLTRYYSFGPKAFAAWQNLGRLVGWGPPGEGVVQQAGRRDSSATDNATAVGLKEPGEATGTVFSDRDAYLKHRSPGEPADGRTGYRVAGGGIVYPDAMGPRVEKGPAVDTKPDDLAHAPEVPHHRFSSFHEADGYAYARGLEVNPTHLPAALDAMAKSGWHLLTLFGETDTKHIGFIFKRREMQSLKMSIEGDPQKIRDKLDILGFGRQLQP
jgi:hypothetical protein